ncbi:MAG: molybdopterin-binding protein [Pseudomonadota bacterium]
MTRFDTVIVADWSARSAPSPKAPTADAIWIAVAEDGEIITHYLRTRADAAAFLTATLRAALDSGRRVLAGFDFPFGYPAGFAQTLAGQANAFAVWDWLANTIEDAPDNANNRFVVANAINQSLPGTGPFWGRPSKLSLPHLPDKGSARAGHGFTERRAVEGAVARAQPTWKLYTTGSVGSQALLGLPVLQRLRERFGSDLAVWPFEAPDAPIVLAEVYPSLLDSVVATEPATVKDEAQVRVLARALERLADGGGLDALFNAAPDAARQEEGWILGVGAEAALRAAALRGPGPRALRNDCFALPQGVDWVPVDDALDQLRREMHAVTAPESCDLERAGGRILAEDVRAARSHPPHANAAVDGYGFAHTATGHGPQALPLLGESAAAGGGSVGPVPKGSAIRILTGAALPKGVDTVILEEDTTIDAGHVRFNGPVKQGANARKAGEDIVAGDIVAKEGTRLGAAELALLAAANIGSFSAFAPLRIGVLSTGDELVQPGTGELGTPDANRPMLLSLVERWGHQSQDLGIAPDDRDALRSTLDDAASRADAILTSGGASAGDEDHMSALMATEGSVATWRVAIKPGRPLLLGQWRGTPVFGFPGNPVAAFVCALVFARPALSRLAGGPWLAPAGRTVPAAFSKRKKPGRREYLRARLTEDGAAEVFPSEGSGRVSGLSWATGFVELADGAATIAPGDPVRFLPYSDFGL